MEYLPIELNKLVQAVKRMDWPAVRNILKNEPHLNETVDEFFETPLMQAVQSGAPDGVLENMIETATVKCLEHQKSGFFAGSTILHYLAIFARVSPMRRVLEKTNENINTQDKFGLTPLHDCLQEELTHEQHKELANCLITFGASVTIKDVDGKTPLDLYDDNECKGYEETTRSEKKQDLKELLERLSIPSEILARGPDAVKAFKDALETGEITVVNSRLMFLGNEGSGKTSCVRAMLGKEFNKEEPPTDGIVTTIVFQTDGDYSKWEEQKDVDELKQTRQILEHGITTDVAKKMEQLKSEQNKNKYKNSSDLGVTSSPASVASTSAAVVEQSEAEITKEKPVSQDTGLSTKHFILRKKVFENIVNQSSKPTDVTCIWDYAGQLDYYITHRFFLTDRTSYGVVFSLLDALDELAKSRDPKKGFLEMTNLQSILFWIRSIFEHAVLLHGSESKNVVISLIGTHKDLLQGSDAEKQAKIDEIFDRILKAIKGEPYEYHVDRTKYAVDNTTTLDECINKLKKNVGGHMKAMARPVPIKWVEFQVKVLEIGKTTLSMSLDEITKIADQCGINEDKVIHVLNYLNDIGVILYSATKKLKNTVITNIHMLIGIFMKIITVVKPDDVDKYPVMIQYWRKFSKEGILTKPLAEHLWTSELTASKSDGDADTIFDHFIELMKMFGLLFEKNKSDDGTRQFVVPSRLKAKPNDRLEIKKDDEQTVSIYVTPKDFLPDAVYDVLVVRFVSLSQDRGWCEDPKLFQNQAKIKFSDTHYLKLGRITIDNKPSLIKLEISKMKVKKAEGAYKQVCKPDPDVCIKVLDFLKQYLNEVYPSKKIVGYALQILCLVCSDDCMEKPHFQDLEICLKGDNMTCDRKGEFIGSETTEIQKFFVAEKKKIPPSDEFTMQKPKTGEQTAMEDKEFQELKTIVSQWYDSNESVPLLKVLFRDKIDNYELSPATHTMDLLIILLARGHLSSQNLGLLCDTISITNQFGLLRKIKQKLPSFPDVEEGTISKRFTSHRQMVMKFGKVLTPDNVTQIDQFYNTPPKKYKDGWSMINDLEDQQKISEENMKEFTDSLKILELSLALKALTEV